jgi:hypothetical protein
MAGNQNHWIGHVKKIAIKNHTSFIDAIQDPKCKLDYKPNPKYEKYLKDSNEKIQKRRDERQKELQGRNIYNKTSEAEPESECEQYSNYTNDDLLTELLSCKAELKEAKEELTKSRLN